MNIFKLIVVVLATTAAIPVYGAGMALQPGLWQMTTKSEYIGMPFSTPPVVVKRCLTKKQIEHPWVQAQKNKNQQCKFTHTEVHTKSASWTMECSASNTRMTGTGETKSSDSKHFSSVAHMLAHANGTTMKMEMKTEGVWVNASCGH